MITELREKILKSQERMTADTYFNGLENIKLVNIISDSETEQQFWNASRKTLRNNPKELDKKGTTRIDLFNWIKGSIAHLFKGREFIFNVKNTNVIAKVEFSDFEKALDELIHFSENITQYDGSECVDITFCNENYFVNIWQGEYNYELYLEEIA